MSNTDIIDRADPRAALDAFSRSEERGGAVATTAQPFAAPADRIVGAQPVAVYRDDVRVLGKLKALAAAAGQEWFYRYPVKNNREGRTDWIEGPSIKLANDLARTFGNCGVDTRVQDLGDAWLIYARFTDYETGFDMVRPFQQRKSQRGMKTGDDRALDIALQIGVSKAIRNVVTNALQTFADFAFEEARNALVGKIGANLQQYREVTARKLADHVDIKRVEAVIGRTAAEWLAPDVARVIAMMKAVTDGMASLEDTFPPLHAAGPADGKETAAEKAKASVAEFGNDTRAADPAPKPKTSDSAKPAAAPQQADADEAPAADSPPVGERAPSPSEFLEQCRAHIAAATDPDALGAWFRSDQQKQLRLQHELMADEVDDLQSAVKARVTALRRQEG
ncbi:hypothetical protein [Ancylobacter sp.]|uniref:hypothetical protein n=1 Tax=Ancylobacter sp. TaxID=1872567 RepID=UPI003D09B9E4